MIHVRAWVYLVWCAWLPAGLSFADDASPVPTAEERPAQNAIRELAESTVVQLIALQGEPQRTAELLPVPVVNYGDHTRQIKDSALWVWMDRGRPVMFEKIEVADWLPDQPQWTFCVAAFAASPVSVTWEGRVSTPPVELAGGTFRPVPGEPAETARPTTWPFHSREISRKFTVESWLEEQRSQLRLLPKPLVEFRPDDTGTRYGEVFAFAMGTNPDLLLQLRLESQIDGTLRWTYAVGKLTSPRVVVNYGDAVAAELAPQEAGQMSNWGYFNTPRDPAIK